MKYNRKEKEHLFLEEVSKYTYDDFLEILKIEFGDFILHSEHGKNVMISGLRARQKSIMLRKLLCIFREKSLKKEKVLNERLKAKKVNLDEHTHNR